MAFDKETRNQLASLVTKCRHLLTEEFTKQCQSSYGIRADGSVVPLEELTHLSDHDLGTARQLRVRITYLEANDANATRELAIDRMLREQAFTVMNRLAAMRMAEARGLIIESVSRGMESQGFEMYDMLGGAAMGERFDRYHSYLYSMFDELAIDLGVLFDRYSPYGLLFPRETALKEFMDLLNQKAMESIWAEDETIGWIYQYWNSKEERKAMRDASAAPRNSRELAVRNQFFTPRYVVEFLTDNTLGRIWYEMTQGQTRLAEQCRYLVRRPTEIFLAEGEEASEKPATDNEQLSQEELLQQPVHIPHRPVKDPREIRLLDPACGSMHFGLYAFDLFEAIYEEAWDLAQSDSPAPSADPTFSNFKLLTSNFSTKEDFMKVVPSWIIEHNIHGVDIDLRAVQIAGLSLWLRAQKTWKDTPAAERPRVRRSNIVCAEPMPGSDAMLEDFVQTLDPPLLGELVKTVFDKMQLAGEAGTLLKIEEEIRTAIDDAKAKWEKLGAAERDLFSAEELNQTLRPGTQQELTGVEKALTTDHRPLATDFFDTAEERIYAALRDYAESAEAGDYQRRLFAEDAAHGFAFIDLCRKRYDAVVMNPPFGEPVELTSKYLTKSYQDLCGNVICGFIERTQGLLTERGAGSCIIDKTATIKSSYSKIRERLLQSEKRLSLMADLGWGVLDGAQVETVCLVLEQPVSDFVTFHKKSFEQSLGSSSETGSDLEIVPHVTHPVSFFLGIPNMALAYDLPTDLLHLFSGVGRCEPDLGDARQGLGASDSWRWYRAISEVPIASSDHQNDYSRLTNGGGFAPFFRDHDLAIFWKDDGRAIKAKEGQIYGSWSRTVKNVSYYFRTGASFPKRTDHLNAHALPKGFIFTVEGLGFFPRTGDGLEARRWQALCLLNCRIEAFLINRFCGQHKHVGYVKKLPLPDGELSKEALSACKKACDLKRAFSARLGNTTLFSVPALFDLARLPSIVDSNAVDPAPLGLRQRIDALNSVFLRANELLNSLQITIDSKIYDAFCLSQATRELVEKETESRPSCTVTQGVIDTEAIDSNLWLFELEDYLIGCVFGRWDIRYATGERQPPKLPDPFDPLPVCPPGMLQNADGLPAAPADVPDDYPLPITWPGILVSDPGHPEDIVARVRDALAVIWGDRSSAIEQEACEILSVRTLRDYFAEKKSGGKFFKDHLKRYSKSRRQAPIYWPLSTETGTYTLWIYYHRLDDQTLYSCIANFVAPKIEQIEKDLSRLQQLQQTGQADAKTTDEIGKLSDLLNELRNFQDELKRLAPLWKPNLNDGVQITAAPLWKLFRLKPWQKKLKDTWTKLEKGDYDWAHLAYSLWPERVKEKCKKDKSLAIAHNLEDLYIEPPAKKKTKKKAKKA